MVSVLPLNNNLWLGEKSPSLSLGVYYNSIMVDKNITLVGQICINIFSICGE